MAERLKRAAAWLGLVTDDRYPDDEAEPTEGVDRGDLLSGAAAAPDRDPMSGQQPGYQSTAPSPVTHLESRRSEPADPRSGAATAAAVASSPQPQPQQADLSRIVTVHPRTFNDARTIGEHFRDEVPVIMNVSQMENADAKRLVDFAAGLILGLRGNIERITSKVFLLSPHNINVTAEDKERIAGGFFNQS